MQNKLVFALHSTLQIAIKQGSKVQYQQTLNIKITQELILFSSRQSF